jgi:DNA-binding beta-propeller fold protein YncE
VGTSIDNLLLVLRCPSEQLIDAYDTKTFIRRRSLQVKDLSDDTTHSGLASCVINKCVYISDPGHRENKDTVYKIDLSTSYKKVFSWRVGLNPHGLSVNSVCHLLVACRDAKKIQEYTTSGLLVREISLQSNDVTFNPHHAIQLTNNQFVMCCWNETSKVYDVVEVDQNGRVVVSYTNQLQSTTIPHFNVPRRILVDKNSKYILVADSTNGRIVILNRSLNIRAFDLNVTSVDGGMKGPSCLHFGEPRNRLFVGERSGQFRVLVFDKVINN